MLFIILLSICTSINSKSSSFADMNFTNRQKATYTACQRALSGVQPDPPAAVLRGSQPGVSDVPKLPAAVPQKVKQHNRNEVLREGKVRIRGPSVTVPRNLLRTNILTKGM